MTRIILSGALGKMGKAITTCVANRSDCEIVAGVDIRPSEGDIPCYSDFSDIKENADCIIDFSNHASIKAVADYAVTAGLPLVVATTGHTDEEKEIIRKAYVNNIIMFAVGIALTAFAIAQFTLPNKIVGGGVSGMYGLDKYIENQTGIRVKTPGRETEIAALGCLRTVCEENYLTQNGYHFVTLETLGV